ncbi:nuclear transport factor 2 family protein [Flavobacterium amniphilum]|uniref:nuclear transport factor 2 family protein n=1 Tax=Flavobacterium amniphilum TaxID=1834035 RepID=UPI00202A82B6|nr:nuclear transport factor 2 family protein [Flavobacterium amniphilum]MCL9805476.1 nuclear transport factor 2 family protein [Flavobacterium amniphilum]
MKTNIIILISLISLLSNKLNAQVSKESELFEKLKIQDSIFFERSFNQCDFKYLENAIHKDLTFYHDKSGIQNRKQFLEIAKKSLCGDNIKKPIRKVDTKSLEVFPMYKNNVLYGVVQTGVHSFYIREKNKEDLFTGKAKFIHLYLLIDSKWILKEVISFDHQ